MTPSSHTVETDCGDYTLLFETYTGDDGIYPVRWTHNGFRVEFTQIPQPAYDELVKRAYAERNERYEE